MNLKLCLLLSAFGLIMGIGTIYLIPSTTEPFFWLAIFLICAFLVAKHAPGRYFLHGFVVSIFNSVWVTLAHMSRFQEYAAGHPEYMKMVEGLPPGLSAHPLRLMLLIGPITGVIFGLVLGLFCWIASKFIRPAVD